MVSRVKGGGENAGLAAVAGCFEFGFVLFGGETYLAVKDVGSTSVCIVCLRDVIIGDRPLVQKKESFSII
jgi:hypothetical protein